MIFESNRWIQWLSGTDDSILRFPNALYSLFICNRVFVNNQAKLHVKTIRNGLFLISSSPYRFATGSKDYAQRKVGEFPETASSNAIEYPYEIG